MPFVLLADKTVVTLGGDHDWMGTPGGLFGELSMVFFLSRVLVTWLFSVCEIHRAYFMSTFLNASMAFQ